MSTPEELLRRRGWRLRQGLWMVFGLSPFALTAWIGYLIIGIRARNGRWILMSVGFFAFGWVILLISSSFPQLADGEHYSPPYDDYSLILAVIGLAVWLGNLLALQWWINRRWLVWRARNDKRVVTPWYTSAAQRAPTSAGAGGSAFPVAPLPPPAGGPLDLNTATAEQLVALPGFDLATATQVVAEREVVGRYADPAELVTRAGVQPHIFAAIRDRVTVSSGDPVLPVPAAPPTAPANGRRLEF